MKAAEWHFMFVLEPSENFKELICECCGEPKQRAWGFVHDDSGATQAAYFALCNSTEPEPRVGLTISAGQWGDDNLDPRRVRSWVHIEVRVIDGQPMMRAEEPEKSNVYPLEIGGRPLSREEFLRSEEKTRFWSLADYIIEADAALESYLRTGKVDTVGRTRT